MQRRNGRLGVGRHQVLCAALVVLGVSSARAQDAAGPALASERSPDWQSTLERVAESVVVLRVTAPRSFDTERAQASLGTGFVVDADEGLILTNRHLVQPGPVVAEAVFLDHEEVDLQAVYRDPVHDFGLYRFDPGAVRFMPVRALALAPEAARVGLEVRVIGNDAGEKLSILSGTLARLDRPAPEYGPDGYNDFNTFYYQAASGTSGGSSGSPVVDIQGQVVALNAGGRMMAASSFYLPLDRVVRAVELIRRGEPVTRGSLETVLTYQAYDELRRLGLSAGTEEAVRAAFPGRVGMLVVEEVVPGGPADGALEPGDILVRVDGRIVSDFVSLEETLDDRIGRRLELEVERGGQLSSVGLEVSDLRAITPDEYLEVGRAIVHQLSYQQARNHNLPIEGLYVADTGYLLDTAQIPDGALIRAVGDRAVRDLDGLWSALIERADGERLAVRWADVTDPNREHVSVARMDRLWFPMQRCRRNDETGLWPCQEAPPPPEAEPLHPRSIDLPAVGPPMVERLSRSLVMVDFDVPYRIEGVWATHFRGAGVIVDAERGLVAVDRDTVPNTLGDLSLTIAGSLRVPGRVVFVHPLHNVSLVAYDPDLIGETPVAAAPRSSTPLEPGDAVWQVGLDRDHEIVWRETRVSRVVSFDPPDPRRPEFREHNVEVVDLEDATSTVGGVLVDEAGDVRALWASFHFADGDAPANLVGHPADPFFHGLPIEPVEMALSQLRSEEAPRIRTLGVELSPVSLADARELGLPEAWAERLASHDPSRRRVLGVSRIWAGVAAADILRGGDLLLTVGDHMVTRFAEVERLVQTESVSLEILRDGAVQTVEVATRALSGRGTDRVVSWAGAVLHEPHLEVAAQRGIDTPGVYVSWLWYGSPAHRYELPPTQLILEVDGRATPTIEAFVEAVSGLGDGDSVRLRTLDLDRQIHMRTLRLDTHYWPYRGFRLRDGEGWVLSD